MLDDAAVFSILSKCFAPVDKAEWENLSAREAWAEFLDGARFILQNGGSLGLDKSPADYRRGNHAPLQDFLSECEVCALFCPPTYEEKRQFAARHFTGGLPESALPIESLYVNTAKAGDLLSPSTARGCIWALPPLHVRARGAAGVRHSVRVLRLPRPSGSRA